MFQSSQLVPTNNLFALYLGDPVFQSCSPLAVCPQNKRVILALCPDGPVSSWPFFLVAQCPLGLVSWWPSVFLALFQSVLVSSWPSALLALCPSGLVFQCPSVLVQWVSRLLAT